jgi:hypothetical protein
MALACLALILAPIAEPIPAPVAADPNPVPELAWFETPLKQLACGQDHTAGRLVLYLNWLESVEWRMVGRRDDWRAELEYTKFCRLAWLHLGDAANESRTADQRRRSVDDLRRLLEDAAFTSGRMPAFPAGAWTFSPEWAPP